MTIRLFSDPVRVLSIGRNPIQVNPVRSGPGFVNPIRSDPVQVLLTPKRKQASGKKHAEHCLRHLNKTACEIWSVFDNVLFGRMENMEIRIRNPEPEPELELEK